jgi:uncharacterized membrane protein YebE (DUF533 family)
MVDATQILGELLGGGSRGSGNGNLNSGAGAKMLEDLLGVGKNQQGGGGGVFGGGDQQTSGGGGRSGDQGQSGGGVFGGGQQQAPGQQGGGGLGDLLGKALKELTKAQTGGGGAGAATGGSNNPFDPPQQQSAPVTQNEHAEVYVRAMIQAGLSDGRIDQQEQQAILQKVGNVGQSEAAFIRSEMQKGCDVNAFIHTVPRGIEEEVYTVALMAINLDNRTEAQFLDALARGLRITNEQSNAIHDRLGAQRLYS